MLVIASWLVLGCAPAARSPSFEEEGLLRPLPIGLEQVESPQGGYAIRLAGPALELDRALLDEREAEVGIFDPATDVALMTFVHEDTRHGIDELVAAKRAQLREEGGFRLLSEDRFFLASGRYRAASLSLYEASAGGDAAFMASLLCDSARGTIEVHGWTSRKESFEALRRAVLGLVLEGE